ncbi:hypothetical protein TEA_014486 [Camellia sinensis var. sinensis]|uniref:Cystatin domain-containing protein n=1 Tax=Camellia sinensis var. sinensis TaxID=542762 RepID=A0A4S4DN90_CAMSN|nr:hypothetical protein TEA_014486 [Camellia sinensis var. sinensis]
MSAIRTSGSETSPEQKQPSPKTQKLGDDDDNKVKLFPFKGFEIEQQFEMTREDNLRYNKQVKESGGFDVEAFHPCSYCVIRPLKLNKRLRKKLERYSKRAIAEFNLKNSTNFQFVKVHKANARVGFDVEAFHPCSYCVIRPLKLNKRLRKKLERYSKRAIAEFNLKNSTNFQFVKVHKANARVVSGLVYYITFAAKDPAATEFEIFQVSLHAPIAAGMQPLRWALFGVLMGVLVD